MATSARQFQSPRLVPREQLGLGPVQGVSGVRDIRAVCRTLQTRV